ncbi:MAG: GNAT family N-acetyltransferase [Saprospiraceae bacterium]|nr:GNAT family N-acetyltransferase [Saprospiraceae bacterium]
MLQIKRTSSEDFDFQFLVKKLDAYLAFVDGDDHAYYHQFNKTDSLQYVLVAYWDGEAVGCGAIRPYDDTSMEVKRMYVQPEQRGKGFAKAVLTELENWAAELNYDFCILETGKKQSEAMQLYAKSGYKVIENYGQYKGVENSVCFKKAVSR